MDKMETSNVPPPKSKIRTFFYRLSQIGFCGFLHFCKHHSRNFFWREYFLLILIFNLNFWFGAVVDDLEGPKLLIFLHGFIIKLPPNQTFCIKYCVCWIQSDLILGSIAYKPFGIGECYVGRSCSVSLVIGNNFHLSVLENANTRVCGTQIDSDCC